MNFLFPFSLKRAAKIRTFFYPPNFFRLFFTFFLILYRNTSKNGKNMVSLWQIFLVFAKIGAFTIGGGYAMMAIIENEVTKRGWLSKEDFPDIMALAQSAPGILAVNISIFAGYKIKGTKGSIVATLGSVTPSFLIILAIAMLFTGYQDNPIVISIFKGIRPVVVALIAGPMVQMAKRSNKKWWTWILTVAALAMVAFLEFSPIYILLTTIVVFGIIAWTRDNKKTSR